MGLSFFRCSRDQLVNMSTFGVAQLFGSNVARKWDHLKSASRCLMAGFVTRPSWQPAQLISHRQVAPLVGSRTDAARKRLDICRPDRPQLRIIAAFTHCLAIVKGTDLMSWTERASFRNERPLSAS